MPAVTRRKDGIPRKQSFEGLFEVTHMVFTYEKSTLRMTETSAYVPFFALANGIKHPIPMVERQSAESLRVGALLARTKSFPSSSSTQTSLRRSPRGFL